jgi:TonB family protein
MNKRIFKKCSLGLRQAERRLLQAAALALLVTLAMPTRAAAEDRAVKVQVAPIYPEIARRMKVTGSVEIEATVDAAGNVSDAKTVGGNRILAPAAEDAVRKWKFVPGSGISKVKVKVNFELSQ